MKDMWEKMQRFDEQRSRRTARTPIVKIRNLKVNYVEFL